MMVQKAGSNKMDTIEFPNEFPTSELLLDRIQDTSTYSWAINNFNSATIEQWLSNFTGQVFPAVDEKRIALWLLSNFTYYNEKEIDHLCKCLYNKFIHSFIVERRKSEAELREAMKNFCYIPLGNASESGGFIAYHFRKQSRIGVDRFFYPSDDMRIDGDVVLFIDDVTLSATQATQFICDFKKRTNKTEIYLLTIISSSSAAMELAAEGIKVVSCIEVDERNKCFSPESVIFCKFPTLLNPIKQFAKHYGRKIYQYPLGFKDGQYLFGFYYNVPNNTIPIIWSKNNWHPIFERKEKFKNDARAWRTFEKYI